MPLGEDGAFLCGAFGFDAADFEVAGEVVIVVGDVAVEVGDKVAIAVAVVGGGLAGAAAGLAGGAGDLGQFSQIISSGEMMNLFFTKSICY